MGKLVESTELYLMKGLGAGAGKALGAAGKVLGPIGTIATGCAVAAGACKVGSGAVNWVGDAWADRPFKNTGTVTALHNAGEGLAWAASFGFYNPQFK